MPNSAAAYRCQSFDNASAGSPENPSATWTPSNLRSTHRVPVGFGSAPQPLAGDVSPGALQPPEYTTPKHDSRPRFVYRCRLCQRDPEDPSVLFCGHLFCHRYTIYYPFLSILRTELFANDRVDRCIVKELATKFVCPVCKTAVLTRLDLEQM